MSESTQNYSSEEISVKLDDLGSRISFSSGERSSSVFVSSLVSNIDETLLLLEEKLFRPAFNEEDFKRVKKQYRESINNEKKSASSMANRAASSILYGNDNIRGVLPTVKSVDKIKLSDVQSFYKTQYNSNLASVVVVGDIDQQNIMPKLKFLNKWEEEM